MSDPHTRAEADDAGGPDPADVVAPHLPQAYPPAPDRTAAPPPAAPPAPAPAPPAPEAEPRAGHAPPSPAHHAPRAALPPPPETGPQPTWRPPAARPVPPAVSPERPAPTPEDARAFARSVGLFALLVLGAMLAGTLRLPWLVIAPVVAVAAIVVGVRALLAGRRLGSRGAMALLAVGLVLSTMFLVSSASTLVLWPVQVERQECLDRALTHGARDACEATYTENLNDLLDRVSG
ncbi:hypothetical protein Bcav_3014 [Beutenbergia cavernae DSM 12333]|uniref:Uncharacterized protein n=1 Tax=Beutenbergia cavernae (strain ATCC BAA-8 / DSM 12333 / CCUG 43141 / JCM 11478 / NBRC 16432 / NCIMB 13614 / HKI 0122) TaxID=471853 RepID=C5BZS9_BEUC1|nr:hypothetical protein [Beutenbergia cavernae]ACQ81259.1 hypothetical protein Bcav_3014 [Beutenbergia cavernae DSM 12333]